MAKKRVNGRKKGQTAERKLAKMFSDWWGSEFTRTPLSGGFATAKFREDWNAAGDLVTSDKMFPFCVESKKVEGWTLEQLFMSDKTLIHKWWNQTVRETPKGKIPLLVFTKNRSPLFVMMRNADMVKELELSVVTSTRFVVEDCGDYRLTIFLASQLFDTEKSGWLYDR